MITEKSCETAIKRMIAGFYDSSYDLDDDVFEAVVDLCDELKCIRRYTTPAKEGEKND